jgi:hypothetical protein
MNDFGSPCTYRLEKYKEYWKQVGIELMKSDRIINWSQICLKTPKADDSVQNVLVSQRKGSNPKGSYH